MISSKTVINDDTLWIICPMFLLNEDGVPELLSSYMSLRSLSYLEVFCRGNATSGEQAIVEQMKHMNRNETL